MDLFLNNNPLPDLTADFFHDANRDLWKKTRTVTLNFCEIKTIEEGTFDHLTKLSGMVNNHVIRALSFEKSGPRVPVVTYHPGYPDRPRYRGHIRLKHLFRVEAH